MPRWFSLLLLLGFVVNPCHASMNPAPTNETVVLLHGMGLRSWAMSRVENALEREGYRVINLTYPSRSMPLETLSQSWLPEQLARENVNAATRLHFVTHSLGGILLRTWLRDHGAPTNFGRAVMLAPPNRGSEVAEHLKNFPPYRWITGVNGARLGTSPDSAPLMLGRWPETAGPLGIIAGDRSLNPLFSAWIEGPDDGKVGVARAQLEGAADFLVLHHSHTWLQWRADTHTQIAAFLRNGRFARKD